MRRQIILDIQAFYSRLPNGPVVLPIRVTASYHYQEFWLPRKGRCKHTVFRFRARLYPPAVLDGVCYDRAVQEEDWEPFKQRREENG